MPLKQTEIDAYQNWQKIVRNTIKVAEARRYETVIEPAKRLLLLVDRQFIAIQRGTLSLHDTEAIAMRNRLVQRVTQLFAYAQRKERSCG